MSALLTEHESHQPAHEVEDARDQIPREAEDGLDGGEDAADDAGEDFEEGGDEVGDACRDGGHGCGLRWVGTGWMVVEGWCWFDGWVGRWTDGAEEVAGRFEWRERCLFTSPGFLVLGTDAG